MVQIDASDNWENSLFEGEGTYTVKLTNTTHPGQSFYYNNGWVDGNEQGYSMRINALTVDVNAGTRYRVTFLDADGNQIGQVQRVKEGENATPPTAPEREGYTFKGWSGSYENITADTTLTAQYTPIEYTIDYVLDGGTNADGNPAKYTIESDDITLADPTREGCLFLGWYERSDFSGTPVTVIPKGSVGDLTLYAKWIDDSEGVMTPIFIPGSGIVDETQKVTIKSNSGAKLYYTMDGTVPSATNGIEYKGPFSINEDVTIKAIAIRNGETSEVAETEYYFYIISLELSDKELTLTRGDTKSLTAVKLPTERTKTDLQWSSSDKSVATVSDAGVVTAIKKGTAVITARTTDYMLREVLATCQVNVQNPKYTVVFKDADGNQIGEAQQVEEGENAIPPTAPVREGYTFKGWSGSYEKIMADTTLTAQYTPIEYTITYVLNVKGATNTESNPAKYTIESDKIIFADPACEGYIFLGWYDNSRFNGEKITEIPKGSTGNLTLYAKWHEAKGLWMTDVDDQTYTGKAVKPDDFTVYDGLAELTKGVDYTVSYQNNVNANTNGGDKAPCVIIKGKGNYAGTVTKTFKILPADLAEAVVDDIAVAYKNGGVQTPKPVVKWSGKKLTLNKDYELKQAQSFTNPGTYTVTVSGKGNFAGEKSFQFIIMNGDQKLISSVKKSKIPDQSYTGKAVTVTGTMLKLTDKTYTLAEGTDYTLEYGACINAGTYEVLIRGLGKYQGITRTSFRILGTDIKKTEAKWQKEYTYNGTVQTPKPVITDKVTKKQLTEGQNYEIVSYSNNINAGTAKVTVRGIGAYSGTTTFSFKIKPASASAVTVAFANGSKDQPYEKGGVKPKPIVTLNGILLTEGTDYTLSYKNNTVCPEKSGKKPTVVIKGKKNLTGSKEEPFNIIRKDIGEIGLLLLPDVEYSSKAGKFRTTPQLFDTNGKKLAAGTDYEKDIQYQSGGKELDNSDALNAGATITVTIKGKGAYDKTITGTYRIIDKSTSISKAKVKVNKTFYYTGEDIELTKDDLTVTLSNNEQVKDYRIIPYPNNPKKGSAKFLLVGEGNYGGQKTISITIRPQGMKWWK